MILVLIHHMGNLEVLRDCVVSFGAKYSLGIKLSSTIRDWFMHGFMYIPLLLGVLAEDKTRRLVWGLCTARRSPFLGHSLERASAINTTITNDWSIVS